MSLTVGQQAILDKGVQEAQGANSAGATAVTQSEASMIVGKLIADGVSESDIKSAIGAEQLSTTDKAAFENAMKTGNSARPADVAAAGTAVGAVQMDKKLGANKLAFLDDSEIPSETDAAGMAALQKKSLDRGNEMKGKLVAADAAMAKTPPDYAAAAKLYKEAGLPIPDPTPDPLPGKLAATLVALGAADVTKTGVSTKPNFEKGTTFRATEGMAHRALLMDDMKNKGITPSNPPTEAQIDGYMAKVGKGGKSGEIMHAAQLVQNASLIHYRSSDSDSNITYAKGYPVSRDDAFSQTEVGARRRSNCQLEAAAWFENAKAGGMTPLGIIAVDTPPGHKIGHGLAVVKGPDNKVYVCSGHTFKEVPAPATQAKILSTATDLCNDVYAEPHPAAYSMHCGKGTDLATASEAAYKKNANDNFI